MAEPEGGEWDGVAEVSARSCRTASLVDFDQNFSLPFTRRLICLIVDSMWPLVSDAANRRYSGQFSARDNNQPESRGASGGGLWQGSHTKVELLECRGSPTLRESEKVERKGKVRIWLTEYSMPSPNGR